MSGGLSKIGRTPLRQVASHGFGEVEKLIDAAQAEDDLENLRINEKDTMHGMTALHRAPMNGHADCVRYLLDAKADVSMYVGTQQGKIALVLAREKCALNHQDSYEDIISRLIERDPETAKEDVELLSICASNGSIRLIQQLQGINANFVGI